jgi:hypothetical protein
LQAGARKVVGEDLGRSLAGLDAQQRASLAEADAVPGANAGEAKARAASGRLEPRAPD